MKVLQINAIYGTLSTGTIVKHIQDFCRQSGIDAYVAFPKGQGMPDQWSYEIGSVIDHKLHAVLSRIAGKQAYFSTCATKGLLRYIDELKPDIVHLHNLHSNYINLNLLLNYLAKHDIVTVVTMHDCWYFTGGCFHYASIGCEKWQQGCGHCPKQKKDTPALLFDASASILKDRARFLNAIPRITMVGCSEWIANECRKSVLKDKEISFIHNGFDLSIFHPIESDWRKRLGIEGKFVVLGPARKWLVDVNKATYEYFVKKLQGNMVLVLFGCKSIDMDMPENVKQIGFLHSPQEMAEVYSMADVMVNCSREDTLSSLNLEAQACGTPVVTYEATGSKETVDGKCGFAVPTGDIESLWCKVNIIKEHGKAYYTSQCVSWVKKHYKRETNYSKYLKLYKLVLRKQ